MGLGFIFRAAAGLAWGYDAVGFVTPFTNKTVNTDKGVVSDITIQPATEQEIADTVTVMLPAFVSAPVPPRVALLSIRVP